MASERVAMARDRIWTWLKRLDAAHALAFRVPWLAGPLRATSWLAYRGLERIAGENHPHERVLAQARRLAEAAPPASAPSDRGPRVLVFTVRGWFVHAATDALLAAALRRRGARISALLCAGGVPQCDFKPASDPAVTAPLCWRCTGFPSRLFETLGIPVTVLDDLVPAHRRRALGETVARMDRAALEQWSFHGLPLYRLCLPSIQRSLLRGDPGEGPAAERVVRGFLTATAVWTEAVAALLERDRPEVVLLTNGLFHAERILLEQARARGIRVVSTERGWPPQTLFLDLDQPAARFETGKYWESFRDRPLTDSQQRRLDAYLEARKGGAGGIEHLWPRMQTADRLGLEPQRPMVAMFTNILWDTAIFERDVGFRGMFDWVTRAIRVAGRHPDLQLVIRIHPAEVRLPMAASRDRVMDRIAAAHPQLPANVRVVPPEDGTSSYAILHAARAVAVYTSTVGLEAALLGKRVLVAGAPHYRGCGFTRDVEGPESFEQDLLEAVRAGPLPPEAVERARRYANLLLFELMHPFPYLVDQPRGARRLDLASLAELDPGRDAVLDRLCASILEGTPPVEAS